MRFKAAALAAVIASTLLSGCLADPLPWPAVRDFLLAWQSERYQAAAAKTTGDPERVATALRQAQQQLNARDLRLKVENIDAHGDTARATFVARMWLNGVGRRWTYEGHMRLRRREGAWEIIWSPSVIHPKLSKGEELAVVTSLPAQAPILGSDGQPLVHATPVVTVGVQPNSLADRRRTVSVLSRATGADPKRMRSLIRHSDPSSFVPVATMRRAAYAKIRYRVQQLPGLRLHKGTMPLPEAPSYAGALLGGVGSEIRHGLPTSDAAVGRGKRVRLSGLQLAFRQRLSGTPGSEVITLGANGRQTAVLARMPGQQSRPVRTTIDGHAQEAADAALTPLDKPAALVAVQASTGKVLAVANRPAGSSYNRAFVGKYQPGSAFKIVATGALLSGGLRLSSPVPCPSKRIVDGETFRNRQPSLSAGETSSFRRNFADSCTTAFVGLSRKLPEPALRRTASMFGIGGDWDLPLPVFTGSVPAPEGAAGTAAATIGEGTVRVSPLAMALAVGAIDSGTWHPPVLVSEPGQQPTARARALPAYTSKLRRLLRLAVESGTARAADLPGRRKVYGTTGTAVNPDGAPHGWFIGFRGDIAFAVLVEGGGDGSQSAAPVAADFLRELRYPQAIEKPRSTRARASPGG